MCWQVTQIAFDLSHSTAMEMFWRQEVKIKPFAFGRVRPESAFPHSEVIMGASGRLRFIPIMICWQAEAMIQSSFFGISAREEYSFVRSQAIQLASGAFSLALTVICAQAAAKIQQFDCGIQKRDSAWQRSRDTQDG